MRILVVFLDMIRPNRLPLFNPEMEQNPLSDSLRNLGGTFYTNCFTSAPDTPRSLACFATGLPPYLNGCDSRVKWPRHFLDESKKTLFDLFLEKNFEMTFFSNPNERETGMFPEKIFNLSVHNMDYDLNKYLSEVELKEDHFIFVGLPDYHWSFDDHGYSTFGEKKAYEDVSKSFDVIFNNLDKNDFDHIFVFSDHGFKFSYEYKYQSSYLLLNEDRSNILMCHRPRECTAVSYNHKLCSLEDLYMTIDSLLNEHEQPESRSLLSNDEVDYIISEDHIHFSPSVNQNLEIWALIKKNLIYFRTLEQGYILDRANREVSEEISSDFDDILKDNSSFGQYFDEYEKMHKYRELIFKQTSYMYGGERQKLGFWKKTFDKWLDIWCYKDSK
tara:strand:- start:2224 stop:3384 length:1161 start_codon:yes stop_codon:yes gene_type:complete